MAGLTGTHNRTRTIIFEEKLWMKKVMNDCSLKSLKNLVKLIKLTVELTECLQVFYSVVYGSVLQF